MSYNILTTSSFERELKQLAKKYPAIKKDVAKLAGQLAHNPGLGEQLGNNCYKIRISITGKGRGKSGGGRVITYVRFIKEQLYLLAIYDKSDAESIPQAEILKRIEKLI